MDGDINLTSAASVAAAIRQLAAERNALRLGASYRVSVDENAYQQAAEAFSEQAGESLEKQAVTLVSFNEKQRTVYIYTTKRVPKGQASVLPLSVPSNVKIVYRVAKPLVLTDNDAVEPLGAEPYEIRNSKYACGSSIGVGNMRSAGTIGAFVRDQHGKLFGLSNNHVSGGCSNARFGLPIVAPGIMDVMVGARDPFTIGHHHSVLSMRQGHPSVTNVKDNTDAALFSIANEHLLTSWQGQEYDTPNEVGDPLDYLLVEKVGRTTKHTVGQIDSRVSGDFAVNYKTTTWHSPDDFTQFSGQVYFDEVWLVHGSTGDFSKGGDSGSLVVSRDLEGNRKSIGLVFAGKASGESYLIPIRPILDRFGVQLVSGLGV